VSHVTQCAAALSQHPVVAHATGEVVGAVLEELGERPDLAVLFTDSARTGALDDVVGAVQTLVRPGVLLGATAAMVAGTRHEVEEGPAIALLAARFPDTSDPAIPVRLQSIPTAEGAAVLGLPDLGDDERALVLLADPFSLRVDLVLDALASSAPQLTVIGGLASAARAPGGNRLVLDGRMHDDGAIGVLLPPGVPARAVVSQGCRPIGDPMVVTRATGNLLEELASEAALPRLLRMIEGLSAEDRALAARGLHLGVVVDERKDTFGPGDFLVRNVLGAVREREAVAVGAEVEVGTVVQFQVRDAETADAELRALLAGTEASGALLFTCNGRGSGLFGIADHDAAVVADVSAGVLAGMSCAGELGPIGGRPFLHGFTASVLLFDAGGA
jgi:small ligand-binding sensory domain FIST